MFSVKIFKKHCSKEWLPVFDINNKLVKIQAKERIFNEGDPVKGIYFIEKGKFKVLSRFNEQQEKIIRIAGDGDILGHRGIHADTFPISVEALTDAELTYVPMDIFIKILRSNPDMAIYLINFMSDELRDDEDRMKKLQVLDPKIRIAGVLVKLIDSFGYRKNSENLLEFTLSRADLANMAGTTYESVIRALTAFKDAGYIVLEGKEIAIANEIQLRQLATVTTGKKVNARKSS